MNAAELGEENVMLGLQSINQLEQRFGEIVEVVTRIAIEIEELSGSAQQMSANTEEVSASIASAAGYVHDVTQSATGQFNTVDEMDKQALKLSMMAEELSGNSSV